MLWRSCASKALRAELLIGVIARLEDAVGVSQQYVAGT